jgi:hypothetical protein
VGLLHSYEKNRVSKSTWLERSSIINPGSP